MTITTNFRKRLPNYTLQSKLHPTEEWKTAKTIDFLVNILKES